MSARSSASRERIIPIRMEQEDEKENPLQDNLNESQEISDSLSEESGERAPSPNGLVPKRTLPMCNVKEKIILVIDAAEDEAVTPFKLENNSQLPLPMIKRAVEQFVRLKHQINKKHEYAVVILAENSVDWLLDFTNNVNEVLKALQNIDHCKAEDIFNFNSLFDVIAEHVQIREACVVDDTLVPPKYVVRTILFYGRSYTVPELEKTEAVEQLLESPYYTFDVLMTHEPADVANNCQRIFDILQNVDQKGFAYFFPVSRDGKMLFSSIAKLLGHPLQRPIQQLADYTLK